MIKFNLLIFFSGENTSGSSSSEPSPDADGSSGLSSSPSDGSSSNSSANNSNHLETASTPLSKTDSSSPSKCTLNNHKMEERKRCEGQIV